MRRIAALAALLALAILVVPANADVKPVAVTQAATAITDGSATLRGVTGPAGQTVTYWFEYGLTSAYGSKTDPTQLTVPPSVPAVQASITGLLPSSLYHFRIVTQLGANTAPGVDQTFTTGAPGGLGSAGQYNGNGGSSGTDGKPVTPPVLGHSVGVGPAAGSVSVRVPGGSGFEPLAGSAPVPTGSTIDARNGTVNLVTALADGTTQAAQFHGAIFTVRQPAAAGGMTDLYLRGGSFRGCSTAVPGRARVSAARSRSVRRLWGSDNHGRFRTHGRHSVATVRGTVWSVTDRCDGTLTSVAKGAVSVRDLVRRKTVLVQAGHRYLARTKR